MPSETLGLIDILFTANGGSLEDFANSIGDIYPQVEKYGVESAARWISDRLNRYAQAAPYNYVSYEMVGGFVSDRQRRFVMAGLRDGSITIPYPRATGDHFETVGAGAEVRVESTDVSMYYSMDDQGQTRMQMLRGWDKVGDFLIKNAEQVVGAFKVGVTDALHQLDIESTETLSSTAP